MRVAISPDENSDDPGSVAPDGTTERSLNLRVAGALLVALTRSGVDAWFDPTITYVDRVGLANADGTDVLVACAHNESTPLERGTQFVFCAGGQLFGQQAQAATNVYQHLAQLPGWPFRRPDAVEAVYECCMFQRDTVYVEYLYMNDADAVLWKRPEYPQLVAEATAQGLAQTYHFAYVPPKEPAGVLNWWDTGG